MRLLRRDGTRDEAKPVGDDSSDLIDDASAERPWRGRRRRLPIGKVQIWAAQAVLWTLVLSGPVMGIAALTSVGNASAAAETPDVPEVTVGPEGVAELVTAAWLEADEDTADELPGWIVDAASLGGIDAASVWVERTATIAVTETGPDQWVVVVAARTLRLVDGAYQPDGVGYYAVEIVRDDMGRFAAIGVPGRVPAPPAASDIEEGGRLSRPQQRPELDTVRGFLTAYLTADTDLERWTLPAAELEAVSPAPFVTVEVTAARVIEIDADTRRVRAQVSGITADGHTQVLQYPMLLSARDGRWEVADLYPPP